MIRRKRGRTVVVGVLSALTLAATLITGGGAANAGPDDGSARGHSGAVSAPAGSGEKAAEPSPGETRVQKRKMSAAAGCGTTIQQPGGTGTTILVTYAHCGAGQLTLTPYAWATNNSGTYTFMRCVAIDPNWELTWYIYPSEFPPTPTYRYSVTSCWP
jgi:hypothetical protein